MIRGGCYIEYYACTQTQTQTHTHTYQCLPVRDTLLLSSRATNDAPRLVRGFHSANLLHARQVS